MAMRCSIPVLLAFLLVLLAPAVVAVTTADIDAQIANVERGHSDDASRRSLIALYQQARSYLDDAAASGEARERFRSAAAKANGTLRELASERRTLERALGGAPLSAAERRLDMVALEAQLEAAKTERALADDRLRGFDLRLQEAQGRPAAIPAERTALATRIGELEQELGEDAAASTDELGRARRALAEAELVAKQAALDALNEEQASYAQRLEVLQARRAVAELKLQLETQRNTALEEHLLALREEQARLLQADVAATSTGNGADAALRRLARDNVALGAEMSRIIAEQARINAERGADQARRERLAAEFDTARGRVDVAGGSASIGRLLVEQRRKLPAPRELLLRGRAIDDAVTRIVLRRIEIEDQRRPLARPAADGDEKTRQRLDRQHQELLAALDDGYVSYLRALAAAEVELQRLQETTTRFAAFLDQHLLWLPNAPRLGAQFARDLWASLRWFASPGTWRDAGGDILAALAREVLWLPAALVALALAVTGRRRFRQHLHEYAVSVRQRLNDRVRNTAFALLATTLLALPLPLACWLLAMLLARHGGDGQFAGVLAQGLFHAASLGLTCLWWHAALWRDGLAVAHFGWNPDGARRLRAALGSFTAVFVPAFALATMFEWQGSAFLQHGFGRLAFALAMLAAAAFGRWLLGGRGPIGREFQLAPGGLVERSRRVWSAVLIFLPVLFLLLSAFGYHYTALELGRYYTHTVMLILAAVLVHNLVLRWLLVAETRLALKRVWARHDERAPEAATIAAEAREEAVDLATINAHTRLVLRNVVGWSMALALYWIWKDVLPALNVFEKVTLWQISVQGADGVAVVQPITLASVVFAAIIVGITLIGSRNLPGVLEIAVLQRMHLQHGNRYAYTTLAQYLIVAIGISFALSTLGLRWSQIQWLIAALGVGLGFGLQEIFANFISGLILLFERPIRVGDIVTIGDVSGKVSRIRIRATTITDWDNKELIVPNKNFITDRFVNWTLSDTIQRVVVDVGVAYGTEPATVMDLMRRVLADNPRLLADPAPAVNFMNFGDNALNFRLQGFVREPGDLLAARTEIHLALNAAFAAAGIEVPFPQRDVHLRSVAPGVTLNVARPESPGS